ncbi:MAG: toll/interleukin-1 receptor domain-containing protein [Alphaproteobacteria bacterium]|nr:toll/interleukin-1 receptor domain-containing protein [Alphaproteobacteria bacterium]MBU0793133.1 toll/interleukin-1 receptor domain-containing protein [Alphaproteobacteria bacterium]MBU0875600.1 toll/interleukin-1 receptor domain-containing protein [Alphaproteobacteria bacterium]MBU1771305.1 toll/interleukin-1 receptor domain-containing protein [Alphaproteobacteria bacterium]
MTLYELIFLGQPSQEQTQALTDRFIEVAGEFGLTFGDELKLIDAASFVEHEPKATAAAIYFGGDPATHLKELQALQRENIPIVPVVEEGKNPTSVLPEQIHAINACFFDATDTRIDALVAAAQECLGLLRRQRRMFISYRRNDSREMAVQLHDELSGAGFDVFLDTHDIRPGETFQEMLWHRLADCDVVIMIDTPDYFGSKWTKQEFGRTLAQGIQVLRLVWPGHQGTRHLSLSDTISLTSTNVTPSNRLTPQAVEEVIDRAERLRSRSVASRHMSLAGAFRVEVERIGGVVEGIGPHRAILVTLPNGLKLQAYPAVGVPTADLLNDVHRAAEATGSERLPCLVYDHTGIRPTWIAHLDWLDERIKEVRGLRIFNAGWELAAWDS